ncbi:MAG: hypothetical protein ACOX1S_10390 [Anaerostipes sp.]|jgi:hypothetical protein
MKIDKKLLFIITVLVLFAVDCVIGWAVLTVIGYLIGVPISGVVVGAAGFLILLLQFLVVIG